MHKYKTLADHVYNSEVEQLQLEVQELQLIVQQVERELAIARLQQQQQQKQTCDKQVGSESENKMKNKLLDFEEALIQVCVWILWLYTCVCACVRMCVFVCV